MRDATSKIDDDIHANLDAELKAYSVRRWLWIHTHRYLRLHERRTLAIAYLESKGPTSSRTVLEW